MPVGFRNPFDPAFVDAGLLVLEDVLHQGLVVIDPVDLGDVTIFREPS